MPVEEEVISDWDAASSESEQEPDAEVGKSAKATDGPQGGFVLPKALQSPLADPEQERERIALVQEARDMDACSAMFGLEEADKELKSRAEALLASANRINRQGGGSTADQNPFEVLKALSLSRQQDVEALVNVIEPKITESQAKSATWLRMLDRLLVVCSGKMEATDLATLLRKVQGAEKAAKAAKNMAAIASKKGMDLKKVSMKNIQTELDTFDGKDSEVSESEDEYSQFI